MSLFFAGSRRGDDWYSKDDGPYWKWCLTNGGIRDMLRRILVEGHHYLTGPRPKTRQEEWAEYFKQVSLIAQHCPEMHPTVGDPRIKIGGTPYVGKHNQTPGEEERAAYESL